MLCLLLAYDAAGNVVATLDHVVAKDAEDNVVGLVDFEAHEEAGGENTDIWQVSGAAGSKVWPEWLGGQAHNFRVELEGPPGAKRIAALVHKTSGYRRERAAIEAEIATRIAAKRDEAVARAAAIRATLPRRVNGRFVAVPDVVVEPEPADIRDLVGGPDRPLILDEDGKTMGPDHPNAPRGTPAHLPVVGRSAQGQ